MNEISYIKTGADQTQQNEAVPYSHNTMILIYFIPGKPFH